MKKRLFAILLTVFMIASLLPTGALAAEAVTYIERRWDEEQGKVVETRKEITDYTLISPNNRINFTVHDGCAETTLEAGWYVVEGNNYYNYINNNEDIRLELYIDGDVKIILKDGALLSVGCVAGWDITNLSDTLTIYGQEFDTGRLETNPSDAGLVHSGIGGRMASVTIHGGDIKAQSADGGAGIGGTDGENSDDPTFVHGCDVTIYGGTVDASGSYGEDDPSGYGGAGIGGGGNDPDDFDGSPYNKVSGNGGNVTIYGGTVTAKGGGRAAGIGGGYATNEKLFVNEGGNGGTVNIYGGHVTAIGGEDIAEHGYYGGGAGIGGSLYGNGGTVNIYGGTVSATGGKGAAGIGGGQGAKIKDYTIQYGNSGTITISGGTVIAQGGDAINSAGGGGAGIGGGAGGVGGEINITGGNVQATGGDYSAGIGNQAFYVENNTSQPNEAYFIGGTDGTVNISGGIVTANGGSYGTGIGNAYLSGGSGGTVNISGGMVTAGVAASVFGSKHGSGIGNPSGEVNISGGDVTAVGSADGLMQLLESLQDQNYTIDNWWEYFDSIKPGAPNYDSYQKTYEQFKNCLSVLGTVTVTPQEDFNIAVEKGSSADAAQEVNGSPFESGTHKITIALNDFYFHSSASEIEQPTIYIAGNAYYDSIQLRVVNGKLLKVEGSTNIPDILWNSTDSILTFRSSVDLPAGVHEGAAIYCPGNLNIVLQQDFVTVQVTGYAAADSTIGCGIYVDGDLTISGPGALNATGTNVSSGDSSNASGIHATGDITISGGTINATGNGSGEEIISSRGIMSSEGGVTITGGTVTAVGGKADSALGSYGIAAGSNHEIEITGGEVTAEGGSGAITKYNSSLVPVVKISPPSGRHIAVDAGENAESAAAIDGSPFSYEYDGTDVAGSINGKKYFHSYEVIPATGLTVTPEELSLGVGGVDVLTAKVTPSNASAPNVTWESSASDVVEVEQNGKITALKAGTATITASYGSLSATCVVTVTETAAISQHPADVSVPVGGSASFSVSATVTVTAYQWQTLNDENEWENITGATGDTYTITSATIAQNGSQYRCVVTAGGEELISNPAMLTVYEETKITEQPQDASAIEGRAARFSVTASGTGLKYQWQTLNDNGEWENITGATDSSYTVLAAELDMTGNQYRCVVSGADGKEINSDAAKLTVNEGTAITRHPADEAVAVGEDATFTVVADGHELTYQWQKLSDEGVWEDITGANKSSYTVTDAALDMDGGEYRCIVTGKDSEAISGSAELTVYEETEITKQPDDATVTEGATAVFSVTADGTDLDYQWQVNSGSGWTDIEDAIAPVCYVTPTSVGMTGNQYRCVVSGADGKTVESNAAKLTVSDTGYFISVAVYGEGTASASKTTANAGEKITLTAKPAGGYHFESWVVVYGGVEIDEEDDSFIMPESGVTILAVFARNYTGSGDITLTFKTRGGTELEELTVARGSTVDLRGYMSWREGFDFAGWYSDGSFMERLDEIKMDGSRTVYAGWEPFDDVGWADWFHDNVVYVYENGLMNGTGAAAFEPDGTVTRGMIVTILHRLEGEPAVNYLMPFTDVAEGAWYAEAVRWAASEGIVTGVSETLFAPNDPITREQFAAILWRYAKYKGFDVSIGESANILSYADFGEIGEYAIPALQWACGEGIISGRGEGVLDPRGTATRAEAAAMLQRFAANVK